MTHTGSQIGWPNIVKALILSEWYINLVQSQSKSEKVYSYWNWKVDTKTYREMQGT